MIWEYVISDPQDCGADGCIFINGNSINIEKCVMLGQLDMCSCCCSIARMADKVNCIISTESIPV
jgi:hypothetical protein